MRVPQVLLFPCVHDFDKEWRGGPGWRGMRCDGAPHVEVTCRRSAMDGGKSETYASMRQPEACIALSAAARRAYGVLDLGPNGLEPY